MMPVLPQESDPKKVRRALTMIERILREGRNKEGFNEETIRYVGQMVAANAQGQIDLRGKVAQSTSGNEAGPAPAPSDEGLDFDDDE